ncbi:hypothetical protein K501DRAFT_271494 [Backusella circina FSU 941]|nr:hypothetical protein K501DRAFT_271494 [Backusella circina FSU 941]
MTYDSPYLHLCQYNVSLITADKRKPCFYSAKDNLLKSYHGLSGLLLPIPVECILIKGLIKVICSSTKRLVINISDAYLEIDGCNKVSSGRHLITDVNYVRREFQMWYINEEGNISDFIIDILESMPVLKKLDFFYQ